MTPDVCRAKYNQDVGRSTLAEWCSVDDGLLPGWRYLPISVISSSLETVGFDETNDFRDFRFRHPNTGVGTTVVKPQIIALYDGGTREHHVRHVAYPFVHFRWR